MAPRAGRARRVGWLDAGGEQLLRQLADGEGVLDVPAKLSARVRVLDVGNGRKTDATDAHAVVMAALRDRDNLHELSTDEEPTVLPLLVGRRDELSWAQAQGCTG